MFSLLVPHEAELRVAKGLRSVVQGVQGTFVFA